MQPQHHLSDIAAALAAPRRLAGGLNRRQQEPDQHADDRDDDQQLDEREAGRAMLEFHGADFLEDDGAKFRMARPQNWPTANAGWLLSTIWE